jgi:hypothetical protein
MLVRPNGQGTVFKPMREVDYRALRLLTQRSVDARGLKLELALKRLDKAWKQGRLGYPVDEPTDWKWRMCEARFLLGDYSDWSGWEYRDEWPAGLWHNPEGSWQGQKVSRLFIFGEQGIGDEVCFSQTLLDLKGLADEIVFETEPRLVPILERSLGVKAVPARFEGGRRKFKKPDGPWMPLGDIPRNFRRSLQAFKRRTYLVALPGEVEKYKAYLGRIGISWRGAQGSYKVEEFKKGIEKPLSLQYDLAWDEEVETPSLDLRGDLEGLLGLLSNLERLVTVSTSAAHFSAALGVKTDLILAPMNGVRKNMLPFKWLCEKTPGKTPWYGDHVRIFRNLDEYRRCSGRTA